MFPIIQNKTAVSEKLEIPVNYKGHLEWRHLKARTAEWLVNQQHKHLSATLLPRNASYANQT